MKNRPPATKNWCDQQTQFAQALLDPAKDLPSFVGKTVGKLAQKRFNVYRNNIMVSLTEAIIDTYPVVSALVGEEFATAMARVYVGDNLPTSPVLLDYGEGYAAFIETFEPAANLPMLADMAKLEWAWLGAYHAIDETPLSIEALGDYPQEELTSLRFQFCASVQLLRFDHPIFSIWSAHQGEGTTDLLGDIVQQAECGLVNRPKWDVDVRVLEPATHAFFKSLYGGYPLGIAIDKGNSFSSFDPASAIGALFDTKVISTIITK